MPVCTGQRGDLQPRKAAVWQESVPGWRTPALGDFTMPEGIPGKNGWVAPMSLEQGWMARVVQQCTPCWGLGLYPPSNGESQESSMTTIVL